MSYYKKLELVAPGQWERVVLLETENGINPGHYFKERKENFLK
jgi:hypothetical protein